MSVRTKTLLTSFALIGIGSFLFTNFSFYSTLVSTPMNVEKMPAMWRTGLNHMTNYDLDTLAAQWCESKQSQVRDIHLVVGGAVPSSIECCFIDPSTQAIDCGQSGPTTTLLRDICEFGVAYTPQNNAYCPYAEGCFQPIDPDNNWDLTKWYCQRDYCPRGTTLIVKDGEYNNRACRYDGTDPMQNNGKICPAKANPVNPATGNKFQDELALPALPLMSLELRLSYNSLFINPAVTAGLTRVGAHWVDSYFRQILFQDSPSLATVYVSRPDGKVHKFQMANGQWTALPTIKASLESLASGWRFTDLPNGIIETYDANGRILEIREPDRTVITYQYDSYGKVNRISNEKGHFLDLAYQPQSLLLDHVTDSLGRIVRFEYDSFSRMTKITKADGKTRIFHYELDSAGNRNFLTGVTDETGTRVSSWSYDSSLRVHQYTSSLPEENLTFDYSSDSTLMTRSNGDQQTYSFDLLDGRKVTTRSDLGFCTSCGTSTIQGVQMTYYNDGTVRTARDANGVVTYFEWDAKGREKTKIIGYQTPKTRTVVTDWHPTLHKISKITETQAAVIPGAIDDLVRTTTYTYNPTTGDLLDETVTSGGKSVSHSLTYSSPGVVQTSSFGAETITSTYFPNGLLKDITDNTGRVTRYTYDSYGRPETVTAPNQVVTLYEYTATGKTKAITVGAAKTSYSYDSLDRLSRITEPGGQKQNYIYDGTSTRIKEIVTGENSGPTPSIESRLVFERNLAERKFAQKLYDKNGTLLRSSDIVLDPLTTSLSMSDNSNRSLTTQLDNFLRPTSESSVSGTSDFLYDEIGNLKEWSINASTNRVFVESSGAGLPLRVTDPKGVVTNLSYDGIDRFLKMEGLDWGTQQFAYHQGHGMLLSHSSHISNITYDPLNRIKSADFQFSSGDSGRTDYTYRPAPHDELDTVEVKRAGVVQVESKYTYDTKGRLGSEKTTIFNAAAGTSRVLTTSYQYTNADETRVITYPSGAMLAFDFVDGLPRTARLYRPGQILVGTLSNIDYDAFRRLKGWTLSGTSFQHSRTFDPVTQNIRTLDYAGYFKRDLTYDNKDRITTVRSYMSGDLVGDNSYAYDLQGRITRTEGGTRTYDANGNVTKIVRPVRSEWSGVTTQYPAPLTPSETVAGSTASSLIGHWKFDEASYTGATGEVIDSSGQNRHGKFNGSMTTIDGLFGRALDTHQFPLRVMTVPSTSLPPPSEVLSAQVWVRTTDRGPYKAILRRVGTAGSASNGWMLQMGDGDGKVYVRIDTSAGINQTSTCSARKSTDPMVADGRWHLITVALNNGNCKIYIDGVKYADGDYQRGAGFTADANFYVYGNLIGQVDDAALWNRPLTDTEVAQNYAFTNGTPFYNDWVSTGAGSTRTSNYTTVASSNRLQVAASAIDVVRDGMLGYWKFDETGYTGAENEVVDSSGLSRHGKLTGGAATNTTGLFGSALDTTTYPNRIMIVANSKLPPPTETVSAQFWLKSTNTSPYLGHVGRMFYGTPRSGWYVQSGNGNGKIYVRIDTSAGINQTACSAQRSTDPMVMDGLWHHVAVVINNGNCKLYIDGVKYADANYNRGDGFPAAADFLARSSGQVDEVALWNRALTDDEVFQNFRGRETATSLAYNPDGHQLHHSNGGAFKYNSLGELEELGPYQYLYDHHSYRVGKIASSGPTASQIFNTYAYDKDGRLLGEYDKNGSALYEIYYLGTTPVALLKGGVLYMIAADQVDAPRAVFKSTAPHDLVWKWNDDALGEMPATQILSTTQNAAPFEFNLRFPGQVFDRESGLHYNVNRFYNPATGRYLQADPTGLEGGLNPYLYANATPLNAFDPDGEDAYSINFGGSFLFEPKIIGSMGGLGGNSTTGIVVGTVSDQTNVCLQTINCSRRGNNKKKPVFRDLPVPWYKRAGEASGHLKMEFQVSNRPLCSGVYMAHGTFRDLLVGFGKDKDITTKHGPSIKFGARYSAESSFMRDNDSNVITSAAAIGIGPGNSSGVMPQCEIRLVCFDDPPCCRKPESCEFMGCGDRPKAKYTSPYPTCWTCPGGSP